MLLHKLIHPQISQILASAGHHSCVLIADGNYPAATKMGPNAQLVSLNLMPDVPTCNQVLEAVLSAVAVEKIETMQTETEGPYALDGDPPVWEDYRKTIAASPVVDSPLDVELTPLEKWAFYDAVASTDHILTIQTADRQRYANILLTIGVRM
ncbi:MAG: RbsD/FucU family protein [Planctomycetota bacterium]